MKKMLFSMVLVLFVLFVFSGVSFAFHGGGGHSSCSYGSEGMKTVDALLWTFANPHECNMDFSLYSRRIFNFAEKLSKEEMKIPIIRALLQKHVDQLLGELRKGEAKSYGASDHEEYLELIRFYKKHGFKGPDDFFLCKFLQNKYMQRCSDILEEMRNMKINSYANGFLKPNNKKRYSINVSVYTDHTDCLISELNGILEKTGLRLTDIKTSEKELTGFRKIPICWRIRWIIGV